MDRETVCFSSKEMESFLIQWIDSFPHILSDVSLEKKQAFFHDICQVFFHVLGCLGDESRIGLKCMRQIMKHFDQDDYVFFPDSLHAKLECEKIVKKDKYYSFVPENFVAELSFF